MWDHGREVFYIRFVTRLVCVGISVAGFKTVLSFRRFPPYVAVLPLAAWRSSCKASSDGLPFSLCGVFVSIYCRFRDDGTVCKIRNT